MDRVIRLGVLGHRGRMGRALLDYVQPLEDIEVVAAMSRGDSLADFLREEMDVAVDLSIGEAVDANAPAIVSAGIPYIVGATAYKPSTREELERIADERQSSVLIVPNFSIGANLMIRFAAAAASLMDYPVVTERHHAGKADAPSGTATFTARRINDARRQAGISGKRSGSLDFGENISGVLGGAEGDVALHSLRGGGYLAEQQVLFSLPGESLSIEHRSIDRSSFMPGIVYAVRNIGRVRGLTVGLDTILEF